MSRTNRSVTFKKRNDDRLPERLTKAAALLLLLFNAGKIDQAGKVLKVRRQGGYCAADAWLALVVWLQSCPQAGIKTFWNETLARCNQQVVAIVGRKRLPSPAALSRILKSMEVGLLRPIALWLLTVVPAVDALLAHPATQIYDTRGQGWHVFDLDPTVTTLRQRSLPAGEDLPEPMRRADDLAAPGYAGRKRGDVQIKRMTVQHAGSGVWVHGHISPGNGEGMPDFVAALTSVAELCDRVGIERSCAIMRMDGEFGTVPWFSACRDLSLPFITRLNRPKYFEDPEFLACLRAASWFSVPDSGSGPKRVAAELGRWTVRPGTKTRRADGTLYEPIEVRVIACALPKTGKAGRGRVLDGFQVELFSVDLPAEAWPACEAAALYFGRAAEENRFAQEDREFGLDRVASYNLAGQELVTLTGLMLWNLQLVEGFNLETPPMTPPPQAARSAAVAIEMPAAWPRDPLVQRVLAELPWPDLLSSRENWAWSAEEEEALLCPDRRPLALTSVRTIWADAERTGVALRRPTHGCDGCPIRAACMPKQRATTTKMIELSVPSEMAARLQKRLSKIRAVDTVAQKRRVKPPRAGGSAIVVAPLLPARARQVLNSALRALEITVRVILGEEPAPLPHLISAGAADRQCRRRTWEERWLSNQLPEGSRVDIRVGGSDECRALLSREQTCAQTMLATA